MSLPTLAPWNWLTLATLLSVAVWQDLAHRRIPNRLLLCGATAGIGLALLPGGVGMGSALLAALVAGTTFAPLYLLRQMGGGDLKLMTTTGLLVGMPRTPALCLSVAMAGGLLAGWWLWRARIAPVPRSGPFDRMPYAVAVATGTASHGWLTLDLPSLTFFADMP